MKKRILAFLLSLITMLMMIVPTALAATPTSGKCGDNLYWEENPDTRIITISGTGPMYDYKEFFSYEDRFTATPPWGASHRGLIIEPGVTTIGDLAFRQDFSLDRCDVSVTFPDSVTRIGYSAFWWCEGLTSVVIPDSVTEIESLAFHHSGLTHLTIPSSIKEIHNCFDDCKDLASVDIPLSVTKIFPGAFDRCTALKDVYYAGSKEQWEAIEIGSYNDALKSATIHYGPYKVDPIAGFTDIPDSAYYADAVKWAVERGVTRGTSITTFSLNTTCDRAQFITFLWRANGSPAPQRPYLPFGDVDSLSDNFCEAVMWAVENNITSGSGNHEFSPHASCTRAQIVTFLYRAAGDPAVSGSNPFTDVPDNAWYADAVKWAVERGITQGTSATTFSPDADCSRAQIVTFLYRDMAE